MPKGKAGDLMKSWIGGYFETFWSVNPDWTADSEQFPDHPVARGVRPFTVNDEWYFHMRFLDDMKGVTPILTAVPPDEHRRSATAAPRGQPARLRPQGHARALAWAYERPDGGRGFGFTGGHYHWNWGCDSFRTVVLNGIVWVAKIDVPPGGIPSQVAALEELEANLVKPKPAPASIAEGPELIQR